MLNFVALIPPDVDPMILPEALELLSDAKSGRCNAPTANEVLRLLATILFAWQEQARLQAELAGALEQLEDARATIARLNRRYQSAERGLAQKLNPGPRTFGRILANSAASMWHAWALEMAQGILAKEITGTVYDHARQIVNETAGQSYVDTRNENHALGKRVQELESLVGDNEFCAPLDADHEGSCPWCQGEMEHNPCGHINEVKPCPWGEAAANHRARQVEVAYA